MTPFRIVRKIGKMLRGGAGKKEIFLGALLGVLIGFNPTLSMTLFLVVLVTLLLNANIGFTLVGIALGKVASLILSVASFHTGYFIIHKIGLEGLFTTLVNAPFTALMDLDVYAMVGGLPYAIIIGIVFGKFMAATVTKIREQMLKAGEHEKVGKAVGNKFSKFLMWLAFGKQKLSTADVLAKESPLIRKSGAILVAVVLVIGLLLDFLLLDVALKKGIQSAISNQTGAEVNIAETHFKIGSGKLVIENLEVTDPDKPTHNMVQIEKLGADISVSELLRKSYAIDLLAGSVLRRDVERSAPGEVYVTPEEAEAEEAAKEAAEKAADEEGGKSLDDYLAQAEKWKKYGEKIQDYLEKRKENAEAIAKGEKPKPSKKRAVADAKRLGYLKASADLVSDRPAWIVHEVTIDSVELSSDMPLQQLKGSELSSHPALNGQPSTLVISPQGADEPTAKVVLRFDDPDAMNELAVNLTNVDIGDSIKASDSLKVESGKADIHAEGKFSADALEIPFTLNVRNLETNNDTINNLPQLEIPGRLYGSLTSPRVKVELGDQLKDAVVDAAKEKATEEAKKEAKKQMDKALESEEAQDLKKKASEGLKKFF